MIAPAAVPPERRGMARDGVRLLVVRPRGVEHRRFHELPRLLEGGDVVVVNTSATLPAALDARIDGETLPVHVSTSLDDGTWVVELRRSDGSGPDLRGARGMQLSLPARVDLELIEPYPEPASQVSRLWRATASAQVSAIEYLMQHGRPIRYAHQPEPLPLGEYQNVYASAPGSAEMASAGRPITAQVLTELAGRGILVASVVLHAGVSSPETHEAPMPERFSVPPATADTVNAARARGSRVVATGTTVVRALESAADPAGRLTSRSGWTELVLGAHRPARAVTGLITGLHESGSSHIDLLRAVAGGALVDSAYAAAAEEHYLGHEFGDSMLFLP